MKKQNNFIYGFMLAIGFFIPSSSLFAQVTDLAPGDFKNIVISNSGNSDYTKGLILLHEMYNGTNLDNNYAIGTVTARRGNSGTYNRINVAQINSSSAYQTTNANLISSDNSSNWKLRTCMYNGKKYLALEIPYDASFHNHGFKFTGWTTSSGENMKYVAYEKNGTPLNTDILTDIADYQANMTSSYFSRFFSFNGNVGIGTAVPVEALSVKGKILAEEVKVAPSANWPDYVFEENYNLPSLAELENYIKANKHLPGIPDQAKVKEEGISLGEMNRKLLEKVEELTLHVIRLTKENEMQQQEIQKLKSHL